MVSRLLSGLDTARQTESQHGEVTRLLSGLDTARQTESQHGE